MGAIPLAGTLKVYSEYNIQRKQIKENLQNVDRVFNYFLKLILNFVYRFNRSNWNRSL